MGLGDVVLRVSDPIARSGSCCAARRRTLAGGRDHSPDQSQHWRARLLGVPGGRTHETVKVSDEYSDYGHVRVAHQTQRVPGVLSPDPVRATLLRHQYQALAWVVVLHEPWERRVGLLLRADSATDFRAAPGGLMFYFRKGSVSWSTRFYLVSETASARGPALLLRRTLSRTFRRVRSASRSRRAAL